MQTDSLSELTIRAFSPEEWRAYRDLRLQALQDAPEAFCSTFASVCQTPDTDWQARLAQVQPDRDYPIGAIMGDRPVAMAWVSMDGHGSHQAHVFQLWVSPDWRGHGIGRRVLEAAITWARDRQVSELHLSVTDGDSPARRLYTALGFVPVGDLKPMRSGSALMLQAMVLPL